MRQFAAEIESDVSGAGARMGEPRHDDDDWDAKVGYLMDTPADVVSFTFGIPVKDVIAGLRARGTEMSVTVTSPDEACRAAAAGADLLVVKATRGAATGAERATPPKRRSGYPRCCAHHARMDTPSWPAGDIAKGKVIAAWAPGRPRPPPSAPRSLTARRRRQRRGSDPR